MYSRNPARPPRPTGEPSYRRAITLPPNYSGNAFPTRLSGDMPPPDDSMISDDRRDVSPFSSASDCPEQDGEPHPHFGDLPKVSNLPNRTAYTPPVASDQPDTGAEKLPHPTDSPPEDEATPDAEGDTPAVSQPESGHDRKGSPPAALPPAKAQEERGATSSALAPLFPLFTHSHFPLGHGLGQEEIWLLGLVLFLLHEDSHEEDSDLGETILLLAILLLCG